MTLLGLIALGTLGLLMKWIAASGMSRMDPNWSRFICSPLVAPCSLHRAGSRPGGLEVTIRGLLLGIVLIAGYALCGRLTEDWRVHRVAISYLGGLMLVPMGEAGLLLLGILWRPTGLVLPALFRNPLASRSVADFWGNRWNLWFIDWFRSILFLPMRGRPVLALITVFAVSGVMHEWVINLPLYVVTGENRFGSMMAYFLLQSAGVLAERCLFVRRGLPNRFFAWVVVFGPAPWIVNEGLLRMLKLYP